MSELLIELLSEMGEDIMGKNSRKQKTREIKKAKTKEIQLEAAWLQQIGVLSVTEPATRNGLRPATVAATLEIEVGKARGLMDKMAREGDLKRYNNAYWATPSGQSAYAPSAYSGNSGL